MITIYRPCIKKYKKSALKAINEGWISNHGSNIKLATEKMQELLNIKHCILMSNGTCATHCLFLSIKYKYPEIQKIYVPNNVYVAAWNCALMVYDIKQLEVLNIDENSWNICVEEEYIKSLDKNAAVLLVHNLGNIINVDRLKEIREDLIFVEDNCEGFTGKYNGIYSGTSESSLCSSISFYGNKIITTGEGGAFLTNNTSVYEYIKKVYSQGMSETRYLHNIHAYNYRMTNIEAGFLYDQLNDFDQIIKNKKMVFDVYKNLLNKLLIHNKIKLYQEENGTICANWIFPLRILNNKNDIEYLSKYFIANGIDIRPFFYPINYHEHLSEIKFTDEMANILNNEIIMIPSSPDITLFEQKTVVSIIYKYVFDNEGIKTVEINESNIDILNNFIETMNDKRFRYYDKRDISIVKNHILTIILLNDTEYVGYAHIDYEDKYWFGIYINPKYRKRGIATRLLNMILCHKNINKINNIHLTVDIENNEAIRLYLNNGFNVIKSNDKYHTMLYNANYRSDFLTS